MKRRLRRARRKDVPTGALSGELVRRGLRLSLHRDSTAQAFPLPGKPTRLSKSKMEHSYRGRAGVVRHGPLGKSLCNTQDRRCEMLSATYLPSRSRNHVPCPTNVQDSLTSRPAGLIAVTSADASAARAPRVKSVSSPILRMEAKRASVGFIVTKGAICTKQVGRESCSPAA